MASLCATMLSACAANKVQHSGATGAISDIATTNSGVLAAQERKRQARLQRDIKTADVLPTVTLNASATAHLADNLAPVSRAAAQSAGVGLTWSVLRSVAALKGVQAAHSDTLAADAALRAEQNQLLVEIASVVAAHQRASRVYSLRSVKLERLQSYLSEQQRRRNLGEVSATDLQQIKGRISTAKGALAQARAELASASAQLAAFGLSSDHRITLAAPGQYLPKSEQKIIELTRLNNPVEAESRHRIAAAESNAEQAAFGLLPELNLGLRSEHSSTQYANNTNVSTDNVSLRLDLSVPLFDGGRKLAEIAQQQSKVRGMVYRAHGDRVSLEANVRSTWFRYNAALSSVRYATDRYAAARKNLAGTQEARRVGARSNTDVLNALDEVTESQISLENANHDLSVYGHQLLAHIDRIASAYDLGDGG